MKNTAVFTSTITPSLINWVDEYAKQEKTTKRQVIERALTDYQIKVKKQRMAESFRRASQDPKTLQLAEEGLGDYLDQLKSQGI